MKDEKSHTSVAGNGKPPACESDKWAFFTIPPTLSNNCQKITGL